MFSAPNKDNQNKGKNAKLPPCPKRGHLGISHAYKVSPPGVANPLMNGGARQVIISIWEWEIRTPSHREVKQSGPSRHAMTKTPGIKI